MKKIFLILTAITTLCGQANAYVNPVDSTRTGIRNYQDELGYFQIASRDMGDPRFMFHDEEGKLDLGIGGTAKMSIFDGFGGQVSTVPFNPFLITLPAVRTNLFATKFTDSEIHMKARTYFKGHKIIAFVKIGGKLGNIIELKEAYMSLGGFSFGRIPSFFMDRELSPMTTGTINSARVDITHPLIGYTAAIGEHWRLGIAAEDPWLNLSYYPAERNIYTFYQDFPDITMYGKYRFDGGHVQMGALFRHLCYWTGHDEKVTVNNGFNGKELGFGASLSGSFRITDKGKFGCHFVGGRGIGSYLGDIADVHCDMGTMDEIDSAELMLGGIPVSTSSLYFTYKWTDWLESTVMANHSHIFKREGVTNYNSTKDAICTLANLFWYINEYTYVGAEYMFGRRITYDLGQPSDEISGNAHRVAFVMAFCF